MKNIPGGIRAYLSRTEENIRPDGYLCLNAQEEIIEADGWVDDIDLNMLDKHVHPSKALPILEGLLPPNKSGPTVIHNAHINKTAYFDIHIFYAAYVICVVFVDKTRSAKTLQKEQQIRLNDDFQNEKSRRGAK